MQSIRVLRIGPTAGIRRVKSHPSQSVRKTKEEKEKAAEQ